MEDAKTVAAEQANDPLLWAGAMTPHSVHLQKALRRLTAAVEGKAADDCARDALKTIHN